MSKTKQRTTSKGVAGKYISSKDANRPSSKEPKSVEEPVPQNNMMAGVINMMKASGLDVESPAVKEQI